MGKKVTIKVCLALLLSISMASCINTKKTNLSKDNLSLVAYIVENGVYDEKSKAYYISNNVKIPEKTWECRVIYNEKWGTIAFSEKVTQLADNTTIFTVMVYAGALDEQTVTIVVENGEESIVSSGKIYTSDYGSINNTIYSFSTDATKDKKRRIQAMCEKATDKMFVDIQLLLAQADCTLSEFGFQNYAWE